MTDMSFESNAEVPRTAAVPLRTTQTPTQERGRRVPLKYKFAVGAVALGLAGAGLAKLAYNHEQSDRNKKLAFLSSVEQTQLANAKKTDADLSQNVVILKPGVIYRETPGMIDDSHLLGFTIDGNVAGKVKAGKEQIVAKPMIYKDGTNVTWLGFTFDDGKPSTTTTSSNEVADNMVWVNASKLRPEDAEIAARQSDELHPFNLSMLLEHIQKAKLNQYGQFISENEHPIAWSPDEVTFETVHRADVA